MLIGDPRCGELGGACFQHGANLDVLPDLVGEQRGDDGAAIADETDQPFGLQAFSASRTGIFGHFEALGEVVLAKDEAASELPRNNGFAQGLRNEAGS